MSEEVDWQAMNAPVIEKCRSRDGDDADLFYGMPILLLTTIGRKSGKKCTCPLVVEAEGDRAFVIASKGGSPSHPIWYLNLKANPDVTVEREGQTYEATAEEVDAAERDRIYARVAAKFSNFGEYEESVGDNRKIPVIELVRKG